MSGILLRKLTSAYHYVQSYFAQKPANEFGDVKHAVLSHELLEASQVLLKEDKVRWAFVRRDLWLTSSLLVTMLAFGRWEESVFDSHHIVKNMMYLVAGCGILFNGIGIKTLYDEVMPRTRLTLQALLHATDATNLEHSREPELATQALKIINDHYEKSRARVFWDEWGTYAIFIGALIMGGQLDRHLSGEWSSFLSSALYCSVLGIAGNVFSYYQLWHHVEPYNTKACDKLIEILSQQRPAFTFSDYSAVEQIDEIDNGFCRRRESTLRAELTD